MSDYAFDDNGNPVPTVDPECYGNEPEPTDGRVEVLVRILNTLLPLDPEQLYRTVQVLGYQHKLGEAARSVPELAKRLGLKERYTYRLLETEQSQVFTGEPDVPTE